MSGDIEPLEPTVWFSQIAKLLDRIQDMGRDSPDVVLRQAMHLVHLTPRPLRETVRMSSDEVAIERMLDYGAYASAVLCILAPPITYTLNREEADQYSATVSCTNSLSRGHGESSTAEIALLIGWCRFLLELRSKGQQPSGPDQHIWQSAQPPRSTSH